MVGRYILLGLTSLLVTYFLTPLVRVLAVRVGAVDVPNERRPHKQPTARGGGLAIVIGVHIGCLTFLAFPEPGLGSTGIDWWLRFALASLVLLSVGIIDDVRGLGPSAKLAGQIIAALLVAVSGTHFGTVLGYKLPYELDCALVVFWIVGVINAFNLIDGLDGLASGLAIISAAGLCGVFALQQQPGNVLILVALIGACLAFLRYNLHPAKIFLGDTGSMFIGFALGVTSLQTFTKGTFLLSMTIPLLVLGVPIFDALLAVWRRSVRKWLRPHRASGAAKRFGLMQADAEHLHHRLLKMGFSTRMVATLLCGLSLGLVVFGLLLATFPSHASGIFLLALLVIVYIVMRHLAAIELHETAKALLMCLRHPTHASLKSMGYELWDMSWLAGSIAFAMWVMEAPRPAFWHSWFLDLPVWLFPTFCFLALSRTYLTVWTRARTRDVILLFILLPGGLLLSLSIALLIAPSNAAQSLLRALVVGAVSHPAIMGVRLVYRCAEEIVTYLRSSTQKRPGVERILLYGAGGRCQLFLKERGFNDSKSFDGRVIVGLLDDDPTLRAQWVQGYAVRGSINDLPALTKRLDITGVVVTAALSPEAHATASEMATRLGLRLTEWRFQEQRLVEPVPVAREAPKPTVHSTPPRAPASNAVSPLPSRV